MVVMTETKTEVLGKNKRKRNASCDISNSDEDEVETNDEIDDSENQDDSVEQSNAGWVDSISKILRSKKPKKKKTLVLSKAKKLTDIPKVQVKPAGFQVETEDGRIKEENIEVKTEVNVKPIKKKRRELPKLRVKPNILEKDRERTLQKVATRGVVQLFNAVRMQQKDVGKKLEDAGPLEVRREKVLKNIDKRAFLDVLMGEKSQRVDEQTETIKSQNKSTVQDSTWSVLKEDFMMGAKMKDWDKELETEEADDLEQEVESESE